MIGMLLLFCRWEHIFDKDSVAAGGVVYKYMGYRADDLAVLQNRAAAHALHNPAAFRQQLRVGHLNTEVF